MGEMGKVEGWKVNGNEVYKSGGYFKGSYLGLVS